MELSEINVGERYKCMSPLFSQEFTGIVEKTYDLSALVSVEHCEENDTEKVDDLNGRLVVAINGMTK